MTLQIGLIIAVSAIAVFLVCRRVLSRKSGRAILASWLVIPFLMVVVDSAVWWMAIDSGRCRGEDYGCDHWSPTRNMHIVTAVLAIGIPILLTITWLRERRGRHQ
jgi:hypothetical protein